ncbi:ultraviolet-B receptor UVR8 isoform X2 [Nymphaea colorata]|uniref:ultraviolet-B receptor UVR8 isoform X2 n=1 Tax=Nymphaea colorata TaxID=210225 RepID=UPI00129D3E7C|nr:ultraviolet-B receptor UVR8 isoform X2 [Nymphaea colorata]
MYSRCGQLVSRLVRGSAATGRRRWVSTESKKYVAMWGNGDFGRLGLGDFSSQWKPTVCERLKGENLSAVSCGGAHTLFLTEDGRVFATGMNDFGQLGIPGIMDHTPEPCEVAGFGEKVVKISAGYRHSAAITDDGALYMWGDNSSGQLGLGKKAKNIVAIPSIVDSLNGFHMEMVALGSEHSVAITENGDMLSWGAGGSGQLGHGHHPSILSFLKSSREYTPRLVRTLEGVKVRKIAAGLLHSACIDENGSVFLFGQRTTDKLKQILYHHHLLSNFLLLNKFHVVHITRGGELYTWGTNENGCLGLGYKNLARVPERVEGKLLQHAVSEVSCGWKHAAAICDGNIFTWGWGGSYGTFSEDAHSSGGQLGHGTDFDYFEPTMVNFGQSVNVLHVSSGFNHTGAIFIYS